MMVSWTSIIIRSPGLAVASSGDVAARRLRNRDAVASTWQGLLQ